MFCFENAPIVAAFSSLLGSLLLVWPVWRASQILLTAFKLAKTIPENGKELNKSAFDEGIKALAGAIEKDAGKWTSENHCLLIIGIGFMILGGLISLVDACCKAACIG